MRHRLRQHVTASGPATDAGAARSREAGYTLIELLVSVAILSTAILGAAGSMFTMTVVSDFERRQALAEVEARRLAEAIRATPYVACNEAKQAYETLFAPSGFVVEAGATAEITNIKFWLPDPLNALDVGPLRFKTFGEYQTAGYCDPLAADEKRTDQGLQRMTVTVTVGTTRPASVSFDVSKRLSQF